MIGAVTTFGLIGLLARIHALRVPLFIAAGVLAVRALVWHLRGRTRFSLDRYGVQAARNRAGIGWVGQAYFGWILGVTVYTQMATPLVQALVALVAASGTTVGVACGIGLGCARSVAAWRGALSSGDATPGMVAERYTRRGTHPFFPIAGLSAAIALGVVDLLAALR